LTCAIQKCRVGEAKRNPPFFVTCIFMKKNNLRFDWDAYFTIPGGSSKIPSPASFGQIAKKKEKINWDACYEKKNIPWGLPHVHPELMQAVAEYPIRPCAALDIGCGSGLSSVWLARKGFKVTGVDISSSAIQMAEKRAEGVCRFHIADILEKDIPGAPFGFVFDIGCFHHNLHPSFVERVASHLEPGGLWFSLVRSADRSEEHEGPTMPIVPPKHIATDIVKIVEKYFEIHHLRASSYGIRTTSPAYVQPQNIGFSFWACLMCRRPRIR